MKSKNESLTEFCSNNSVLRRTLTVRLLSCGHSHKSMKAYTAWWLVNTLVTWVFKRHAFESI